MPITFERIHEGRIAKAVNKFDRIKGVWAINIHGENVGNIAVGSKRGAFLGFLTYYSNAPLTSVTKSRMRMQSSGRPDFHGTSVRNVLTMAKRQIKIDLGSRSARLK